MQEINTLVIQKGANEQPFTTNPLAVVPPTHFGSPASFAVKANNMDKTH